MIGKVQEAFVKLIRDSEEAGRLGVNVVLTDASAFSGEVVNTPLPAVAVHVERSEDPQVCVGGLIIDHFLVVLSVITNFTNYSLSEDEGIQIDQKEIPYLIRNLIERSKDCAVWGELRQRYDFSPVYRGMSMHKAKAKREMEQMSVDNTQIVYSCTCTDREIRQGCSAKADGYSLVLEEWEQEVQA